MSIYNDGFEAVIYCANTNEINKTGSNFLAHVRLG